MRNIKTTQSHCLLLAILSKQSHTLSVFISSSEASAATRVCSSTVKYDMPLYAWVLMPETKSYSLEHKAKPLTEGQFYQQLLIHNSIIASNLTCSSIMEFNQIISQSNQAHNNTQTENHYLSLTVLGSCISLDSKC